MLLNKIGIFYFSSIAFSVVGLLILFNLDEIKALGLIIFALSVISLLVIALIPCEHCGELRGFGFLVYVIILMPIGVCIHCWKSYIFDKECE